MSNNCNGANSKSGANAVEGLKKGPWTSAEDAILVEYVRKHGEGNWNSVQKNSGLMRCGKSCRLRWANHLRPNLKKGSFSAEEERIIIDLHSKIGNKWARMASHLPGRTDNEIKNFWNTRMKRRQRAGLPIYPQDQETNAVHPPHHHHHLQQKHPNFSSFSSFISSRKPAFNPSLPFLDSIPFSPKFDPLQHHFNNSSFYSNPPLQFKPQFPENNTNNLGLPLSPVPQPLSLSPFNQNFSDQSIPRTPPLLHYNNPEFNNNMSFTSLIMADQQTGFAAIDHPKVELPSNQTPPRPNTPSSGVCLSENQGQDLETRCSGLLDALVLESRHLASKDKLTEDLSGMLDKGKRKIGEEEEQQQLNQGSKRIKFSSANSGGASATNHSCDDMTSSQSSIDNAVLLEGVKQSEEPMEEMNSMDDDLLSLLDNFPTATPLPEWYRTRNVGDGISTGDVQEVEAHQDDSAAKPDETPNVDWELGSFSNLPDLC